MKLAPLFIFLAFFKYAYASPTLLPKDVKNTQNPKDISLSPQGSLKTFKLPNGFQISLFAAEPNIYRPISFSIDDRGRLWVVENFSHPHWREKGKDRIVILEDSDHDGVFDKRKIFYENGRYLTGIIYGFGGVWVCNTPELQFIPDKNRDDVPDGPPVTVLDGWRKGRNNVINNLTWGPDGWLYGCVGLNHFSYVGKPGVPKEQRTKISRGIWRVHPVNGTFEVVARGAVNPWGLDFNEVGEGFFTNCVIGHLWHLIPGAYYQRRAGEGDYAYTYDRIQMIADHKHWGGGHWTSSRGGKGKHDSAGGGHAQTGAMIYLGDNWPMQYRGKFYTGNIHGNRINQDTLFKKGSSYSASHDKDFLLSSDLWFRTLTQKYGPDGGVYVSDWHDFGECHDNDGSHCSSGRIYKVTYGKPKTGNLDLSKSSIEELVAFQTHSNEYFARHARRLLQEKSSQGRDLSGAKLQLEVLFEKAQTEQILFRALSCLKVAGLWGRKEWLGLLSHKSETVRSWAICYLCEDKKLSSEELTLITSWFKQENSPTVALQTLSSISRLPLKQRLAWLKMFVISSRFVQDKTISAFVWYASEPYIYEHPYELLNLYKLSKYPILHKNIPRRIFETDKQRVPVKEKLFDIARIFEDRQKLMDLLLGIAETLKSREKVDSVKNWPTLYQYILKQEDSELSFHASLLALKFGEERSKEILLKTVVNQNADLKIRGLAIDTLARVKDESFNSSIRELFNDESIRLKIIKSLNQNSVPGLENFLIAEYKHCKRMEKTAVIEFLMNKRAYAIKMLRAVENNNIPAIDINAYVLNHLSKYKDKIIDELITKLFGKKHATSKEKKKRIANLGQKLKPWFMKSADLENGKRLFEINCKICHRLFSEGETIGPDLTGSGRKDINYLLENIVDPNALVPMSYKMTTVMTSDDKFYSGMLRKKDSKQLSLQTLNGMVYIKKSDVAEIIQNDTSMMPEGLLDNLNTEQIRDLFAYLGSNGLVK